MWNDINYWIGVVDGIRFFGVVTLAFSIVSLVVLVLMSFTDQHEDETITKIKLLIRVTFTVLVVGFLLFLFTPSSESLKVIAKNKGVNTSLYN